MIGNMSREFMLNMMNEKAGNHKNPSPVAAGPDHESQQQICSVVDIEDV